MDPVLFALLVIGFLVTWGLLVTIAWAIFHGAEKAHREIRRNKNGERL